MLSGEQVIKALREALALNIKERAYLERSLADARQFYGTADDEEQIPLAADPKTPHGEPFKNTAVQKPPTPLTGNRFITAPDGPRETVMTVVRERQGQSREALLEAAVARAVTSAKNKRAVVSEAYRNLLKNGKLVERRGGIFIASE